MQLAYVEEEIVALYNVKNTPAVENIWSSLPIKLISQMASSARRSVVFVQRRLMRLDQNVGGHHWTSALQDYLIVERTEPCSELCACTANI